MAMTALALLAAILSFPGMSRANDSKNTPATDAIPFPRGDAAKLGIRAEALEKLKKAPRNRVRRPW